MNEFVAMYKRGNWVILDTETTGLERPAEICSIGIIDPAGAVLLDQLVKPTHSIPPVATAVHGITDAMVASAPMWIDVAPVVKSIIMNRDVIVYNATYDRKMMHWSDEANRISHQDWKEWGRFHCAMEFYARFWGERHAFYGTYVWQKLTKAIEQQGLTVDAAHNAVGDCLMTRALVEHVVGKLDARSKGE